MDKSRKYDKIKEHVSAVFAAIPDKSKGETWKSGAAIAAETGLTLAQVRYAVRSLFVLFGSDEELNPLASSWQGYLFTMDKADLDPYVLAGVKQASTLIVNRYRRVIRPFLVKTGNTAVLSYHDRTMARLFEDMLQIPSEMLV